MGKVVNILSAPGATRKAGLDLINKLAKAIRFQAQNKAHFRFINLKQSLSPPIGVKAPKQFGYSSTTFRQKSGWYVTGRDTMGLKDLKKWFVPVGGDFRTTTELERFKTADLLIGHKGTKRIKAWKNSIRKLSGSIAARDAVWEKGIKKDALTLIKKMGPISEKAVIRHNAERRIAARARGIVFRKIGGRIVPVRIK